MSVKLKNYNGEPEKLREKFFDFLLRKPCTSGQAAEYLSELNVPEQFFDSLMNEAVNMALIDDLAYAKLFIDGHLTWGNAKIIYELSRRGVSREEIDEALDECKSEADCRDELSRACELSEEWHKLGLDERKIMNRLLSRGFSRSSATNAISFLNF